MKFKPGMLVEIKQGKNNDITEKYVKDFGLITKVVTSSFNLNLEYQVTWFINNVTLYFFEDELIDLRSERIDDKR